MISVNSSWTSERMGTDTGLGWGGGRGRGVSVKRNSTIILMNQADVSYNLLRVRVFLHGYMKSFDIGSAESAWCQVFYVMSSNIGHLNHSNLNSIAFHGPSTRSLDIWDVSQCGVLSLWVMSTKFLCRLLLVALSWQNDTRGFWVCHS